MRPALFLDRDGVINIDHGYVHRREDFEFIDGIFELVNFANRLDIQVFVITNQAGIGRGLYTENDFKELTAWMLDQFRRRDCLINAVYFCPHHPEHGIKEYKKDCFNRKPSPGMILNAQKDCNINLRNSILIGDKHTDIEAGSRANVKHLYLLGDLSQHSSNFISIKSLRDKALSELIKEIAAKNCYK